MNKTAPYAAAFKPNAAFFEVFGAEGWTALKQVIEAINDQSDRLGSMIPVILDAKRGDIASTAEAYAQSAFRNSRRGLHHAQSHISAKTRLSLSFRTQEKGVFLLCKTSNAGSRDLQDLLVIPAGSDDAHAFIHVCRQTCADNGTRGTTSASSSARHTSRC